MRRPCAQLTNYGLNPTGALALFSLCTIHDRNVARMMGSAIAYWFAKGNEVFVAESDGQIVGTYYLRRNQLGGGSHACNCVYDVARRIGKRRG